MHLSSRAPTKGLLLGISFLLLQASEVTAQKPWDAQAERVAQQIEQLLREAETHVERAAFDRAKQTLARIEPHIATLRRNGRGNHTLTRELISRATRLEATVKRRSLVNQEHARVVHHVCPGGGRVDAKGTVVAPYASLSSALEAARPGDVIRIAGDVTITDFEFEALSRMTHLHLEGGWDRRFRVRDILGFPASFKDLTTDKAHGRELLFHEVTLDGLLFSGDEPLDSHLGRRKHLGRREHFGRRKHFGRREHLLQFTAVQESSVTNCLFQSSRAGGLRITAGTGARVKVSNCVFQRCRSAALELRGERASFLVEHCTFALITHRNPREHWSPSDRSRACAVKIGPLERALLTENLFAYCDLAIAAPVGRVELRMNEVHALSRGFFSDRTYLRGRYTSQSVEEFQGKGTGNRALVPDLPLDPERVLHYLEAHATLLEPHLLQSERRRWHANGMWPKSTGPRITPARSFCLPRALECNAGARAPR